MATAEPISLTSSRPRRLHPRNCAECGAPFATPNSATICCSRECGWKRGRRNQNLWRARQAAVRHARVCRACGKPFTMRRPSGKANQGLSAEGQFCSKECAGSGKRWESKRHRKVAIRRMRKRAGFAAIEIFERDHWVCRLCNRPVLRSDEYPHPASACVNLIEPASKGGKRTHENVVLAHLSCAVHRRARDWKASRAPTSALAK